jgi:hypothetical protein
MSKNDFLTLGGLVFLALTHIASSRVRLLRAFESRQKQISEALALAMLLILPGMY